MKVDFNLEKVIGHLEKNLEKLDCLGQNIVATKKTPKIELIRGQDHVLGKTYETFNVLIFDDNYGYYEYSLSASFKERARKIINTVYKDYLKKENKKKEEVLNRTIMLIDNL